MARPNSIDSTFNVRYYNLSSLSVNSTLLSTIVQAECLKSKLLTAGDINVTALTQVVKGYRLGNVAAIRAGLEPLQAAWPFDVLQSGYTIKFKVRGLSLIHISEPTRPCGTSRMPSSA